MGEGCPLFFKPHGLQTADRKLCDHRDFSLWFYMFATFVIFRGQRVGFVTDPAPFASSGADQLGAALEGGGAPFFSL